MTLESGWVPEACTLPTVERPLRVAEFDHLFALSLRQVHRPEGTRLRLMLDPAAEASARDLVARESQCCSFFTFTFSRSAAGLVIDVVVPEDQVSVLDGIAARAVKARTSRG